MTGRPVRVQPRAQSHLAEAYAWYEQRTTGLGREFIEEVEACLGRIAENPGMYPVYRDRIRRTVTRRFPYLVFYVVDPKESVVLAVLHASRDPRLWP